MPKYLSAHVPKYLSICLSRITSLMGRPIPTALVLQCPCLAFLQERLYTNSIQHLDIDTERYICLDLDITCLMVSVVLIAQLFTTHSVSTGPANP